ncbi:MAG: ABC transporter permease, partial [Acidobacteriota bacterium]
MLSAFRQDVRYALRLLGHSPLFTLTAVLSLAIGIGANTTIFSIASAMLLRPLPGLSNPGRVVDVGRTQDGHGFDTVSYPNYLDLRERTTALAGLYAYRADPEPMSLATAGDTVRIYGSVVSANYFEVLGTRAELGRLLQDGDDRPDRAHAVAVLSHDLWARQFAADPTLVDRTISLNGHPFTVVGIASPGFQGTTMMKTEVWMPISAVGIAAPRIGEKILEQRRSVWLDMGGRLRDGVTLGQANAELQTIGANLQREHPDENRGQNFAAGATSLVPGQTSAVAGFLALLMAIVLLVLLIACVNVAGMLLARAAARRKEIAVRLAIGAGRGRLVRQLLTESLILFAAGGLLGLL